MEEKQNQNVNRLIQYCIKLREQYLSLWRDILHVMKCKKKNRRQGKRYISVVSLFSIYADVCWVLERNGFVVVVCNVYIVNARYLRYLLSTFAAQDKILCTI